MVRRRFMPRRGRRPWPWPVGELHEGEQLVGALRALPCAGCRSSAVDGEVLRTLSSLSESVVLRAHAQSGADGEPSTAGSMPTKRSSRTLTGLVRRSSSCRGLAGAVGTQEPERLAATHGDVDAAHCGEPAVGLGQPGAPPPSRRSRRRTLGIARQCPMSYEHTAPGFPVRWQRALAASCLPGLELSVASGRMAWWPPLTSWSASLRRPARGSNGSFPEPTPAQSGAWTP
jgi:hypothetical protein